MISGFPPAVPEVPVSNIDSAIKYYTKHLGFLPNLAFRSVYGNTGAVMIWFNVNSKIEVDELHAEWTRSNAKIVSPPEDKPWQLREFTAADLDGNLSACFTISAATPSAARRR